MFEIKTLVTFLGWCSVINIAVLSVSTILLMFIRTPVARIHGKLFGVEPSQLPPLYMNYLGNYKLAILMLNLVPYIALKIMG